MASHMLIVTSDGYGKRTPLTDFKKRRRGTKGVSGTGKVQLAAATTVCDDGAVAICSANGMVAVMDASEIRISSRSARGVRLMNLDDGDKVVSITAV